MKTMGTTEASALARRIAARCAEAGLRAAARDAALAALLRCAEP